MLDLAKWDAVLYTTHLLKQSSLDRMWTVFPLNDGKPNPAGYGFAWIIGNQQGHKLIEHGGAWQGFTCAIERYPDDALSVVVLTNLDAAEPRTIARVVAGLVEPPLSPPKLTAIEDTQPAIAAALRLVLDRVAAGSDIRDIVTPQFARIVTPEAIARSRDAVSPVWPGGTLTLVKRFAAPADPSRVVSTFRVTKGDKAILVLYSATPDGKIAALGFLPDREYQ